MLIPDIKEGLVWLKLNHASLKKIGRGIERETLRIDRKGKLAKTCFPDTIGSSLTHSWITTDFAESMLEFVTPVNSNIEYTMAFLRDLHRYANTQIGNDLMWPLSMPCYVACEDEVILAQYGNSNEGKIKTLYRRGLKNRYGAMMQTISGVHYNFSLPVAFWQKKHNLNDHEVTKNAVSDGYFHLIRNYYRFGWIIPFLFGASPSICPAFIQDPAKQETFLALTNNKGYLPYATSLRLSDLGYTNDTQRSLSVTFNQLEGYIKAIQQATSTPSPQFASMGVKVGGEYVQINDNILQIENEFYAPIRPKRVALPGEKPSEALLRGGVEYIEVRSLDVNPFNPVGITEDQIRFIDLFLIWCALAESPEMNIDELECTKRNWNRIIIEGRKPNQIIGFDCDSSFRPLCEVGRHLFKDLFQIAEVLDKSNNNNGYRQTCRLLIQCLEDPELTLSGRTLLAIKDLGTAEFGLALSKQYHEKLLSEPLEVIMAADFIKERENSLKKLQEKEASDSISFDDYVAQFQYR